MSKLRQVINPYTFRGRLQLLLVISVVLALGLSLLFSYAVSSVHTQTDLTASEYSAALSLLQLEKNTDMTIEQMLETVTEEGISLQCIPLADMGLSEEELGELESRTILTIVRDRGLAPITFVQMKNAFVRITSTNQRGMLFIAFTRAANVALAFSLCFILMSIFLAWRIAKPISDLTHATHRIAEGDFSIRLPNDNRDELGDLMRSFNTMTDALERTSWLQKDFIASVSHEFKTPIASIKGYARLLQMPGLDEDMRQEYIDIISQESDRLSRLSDTLLRLTALEQQTAPASISAFALDEQVRQVLLRLEPLWSARDLNLELHLEEVELTSDQELISQVWTNLIHNAIKFSNDGGTLEIYTRRTDMAEFEIVDHGIGMTEETVARMFDRFYQADPSRKREGVGLGLSLVRRILDMLGGEVKVRSKLGEGTSIRVRLPLKAAGKENV